MPTELEKLNSDISTLAEPGQSKPMDLLGEIGIRKHLNHLQLNNIRSIQVFSSITSTNDYMLEQAFDHSNIAVCVAEQQTQGRGRYGHQWVSPAAGNLYLSMAWPLQNWGERFESLNLWLLIALAELLEKLGYKPIRLKWPNDICVQNKKLAGILIERKVNKIKSNLIIGVGLNVAMSLKEDVQINTPWIDLLTINPDWQISRNELAAKVIAAFCATLDKLEENQLTELSLKWNQYDMLCNKKVEFLKNKVINTGEVLGIDDLGKIILKVDDEIQHLHSSQISEIKPIGQSPCIYY
jgi:BirA family biotin operon repressor/biotin-[acetyl-CoA-carboxylase] ligase